MKYILLIFLCCSCWLTALAQDPDPLLFRTWYLNRLLTDDLSDVIIIANIDPPITPTLNFTEPLDANGIGACNTFEGTYTLQGPMEISVAGFTYTTETCANQSHTDFEVAYFGYLQDDTLFYSITQTADGYELNLTNFIFGVATFTDYILPTPEYELKRIKIYPNPVRDELILESGNNFGDLTINIYNTGGKLVHTTRTNKTNKTTMRVSSLSQGLYFMEVENEKGGIITKKFIKM